MKNASFRFPPVYGAGPHGSLFVNGKVYKSGLQIFIDNAREGKDICVYGDKNLSRDVVYVKERQNLFEVTRGSEWLFRNFMTFQALFLCSVCLFAIARAYGYFNHLLENTVLISIGLIMMVLILFY